MYASSLAPPCGETDVAVAKCIVLLENKEEARGDGIDLIALFKGVWTSMRTKKRKTLLIINNGC